MKPTSKVAPPRRRVHRTREDHLTHVDRGPRIARPRQRDSPLVAAAGRTELLAGIEQRAFLDIDSLPRPVYGHAKQGASDGHTKIAGKQVLRRGLSPLATTSSAENAEPVIAGMRLVLGKIYDSTLTLA
jgi:hypothetical protein